jgi:hypothetical protein
LPIFLTAVSGLPIPGDDLASGATVMLAGERCSPTADFVAGREDR